MTLQPLDEYILNLVGASYSLPTSKVHYNLPLVRWFIKELLDHIFNGIHSKPVATVD